MVTNMANDGIGSKAHVASYLRIQDDHTRHGICHGRTDIVRVKFYLPGVNLGSDHTLFVVNSLLVIMFNSFLSNLLVQSTIIVGNIFINVCIERYKV